VAPDERIFRVPLTSETSSSFMTCRDIRRCGYQLVFGSTIRASCNRLGPSGLNGFGWIMLSLIFGPGRVDQSGPSSRVGPNAQEGHYSSQQLPPNSLTQILCLREFMYNHPLLNRVSF
jgi:hypothetical protein